MLRLLIKRAFTSPRVRQSDLDIESAFTALTQVGIHPSIVEETLIRSPQSIGKLSRESVATFQEKCSASTLSNHAEFFRSMLIECPEAIENDGIVSEAEQLVMKGVPLRDVPDFLCRTASPLADVVR